MDLERCLASQPATSPVTVLTQAAQRQFEAMGKLAPTLRPARR
jgi:hypothetical protein